jgi:hypothetical protein
MSSGVSGITSSVHRLFYRLQGRIHFLVLLQLLETACMPWIVAFPLSTKPAAQQFSHLLPL